MAGRPTKEIEMKREELEGCLACLGTALSRVNLVQTRVGAAIDYMGNDRFLSPAIADLDDVKDLVCRSQQLIKSSCPVVFDGR